MGFAPELTVGAVPVSPAHRNGPQFREVPGAYPALAGFASIWNLAPFPTPAPACAASGAVTSRTRQSSCTASRPRSNWPQPQAPRLLMTAYAAGIRCSELTRLRVSDIDSGRMLLRVEQGKGSKDRYVPLSPRLLARAHPYGTVCRPFSSATRHARTPPARAARCPNAARPTDRASLILYITPTKKAPVNGGLLLLCCLRSRFRRPLLRSRRATPQKCRRALVLARRAWRARFPAPYTAA